MKKTIKVLNIIEESFIGGPQLRIVNTSKYLNDDIDNIILIPKKNSINFIKILKKNNLNYIVLKINKISKNFYDIFKYLFFFLYEVIIIYNLIKKQKIDIIHVSGGAWQIKGVISGKLAGIRIAWQINDTYLPFIFKLIFRKLYKLSDIIIYSSNRSHEYYNSFINNKNYKSTIIPSGVDTAYFNPKLVFNNYKDININFDQHLCFGMTANINPIKGIDEFINLSYQLNKKINHALFILICNIPQNHKKLFEKYKNRINELNFNNFIFINKIDDIRPIIKKIKFYFCLSKFESSPVSVWEAMSMGKVIFTKDVGDVSKYIFSGENGEIIDGKISDYLPKILSIVNNKKLINKYETNSRIMAKDKLDIKTSAKKLENIYKELN